MFARVNIYSVNISGPATAARLKDLSRRGINFNPLTRPLEFPVDRTDEYFAAVKKHPREPLS